MMSQPSEHKLIIESLKFWGTLCEKENARMSRGEQIGFIKKTSDFLLPLVLQGFTSQDLIDNGPNLPDSVDDQVFTVSDACQQLAMQVCGLIKDEAYNTLGQFAMNQLGLSQWANTYAGLCALCILGHHCSELNTTNIV